MFCQASRSGPGARRARGLCGRMARRLQAKHAARALSPLGARIATFSLLHHSPACLGSVSLGCGSGRLHTPDHPEKPGSPHVHPSLSHHRCLCRSAQLSGSGLLLLVGRDLPDRGTPGVRWVLRGWGGLFPATGHPCPLYPARSLGRPAGRDLCEARWAHAHRTWL